LDKVGIFMKVEILKALKESPQQYVSGQQLSRLLGVSRTAVWKYISELRQEGYQIESSSRKGYKLITSPDNLSAEEVLVNLHTSFLGKEIRYYETVSSTNNVAKEAAARGCMEGTVIIADRQESGKGRLGRHWVSPPKSGIWMSIVLRPKILPMQAPFITLLAAVAVSKAIEEIAQIKPGIKWPNDIVIHKKKVCGILTEISAEMEQVNYLVVGIGINVNFDISNFPDHIRETATSIKAETGTYVNRVELIVSLLEKFECLYSKAFDEKLRPQLMEEYKAYSVTLGNRVRAVSMNHAIEGYAEDITNDGELMIRTDDGKLHKIISGEVSVRGMYGYV